MVGCGGGPTTSRRTPMALRSLPSPLEPQPTFRDRTLTRLVEHVRTLIEVSAVAFVTVDESRGSIEHAAGWYADSTLREALTGPGLVHGALERDRPLLLPRVDAWEAAPDLLPD